MTLDFISCAWIGGLSLTVITGPLGALLLWRRMGNLCDTLGHAALLGLSLAIVFHIHIFWGFTLSSLLLALLLTLFSRQKRISKDAVLTLLSQASLAIGLIAASLLKGAHQIDLLGFLYGDILAISPQDLIWIGVAIILALGLLLFLWRALLSVVIHEELAKVEGISLFWVDALFLILLVVVFAFSVRLVGALLLTALLVIPACTARAFSKTPEQMALFSTLCGALSVGLGLGASSLWDLPTGPAIVVASTGLFLMSCLVTKTPS